jgi:hypothetical protein
MSKYDVVIVGSGPAGMGCAFSLLEQKPSLKILILDSPEFDSTI